MSIEANVISKVRRRVGDVVPVLPALPTYADEYYQDAIEASLQKYSHDLGVSLMTIASVTPKQEFLLVKLAAIEMCYIRAAEGAGGEAEGGGSRWTSVAVPDLSVTDANQGTSRGPAFWLELAEKLKSEYESEVELNQTYPEVEQTYTHRISGVHGGYRVRKVDPGLAAVSVSAAVSGSSVLLEWTKLLDSAFSRYEVWRSGSSLMVGEEFVANVYDNHETEYVVEDLVPGTYYFRVKTVNPNEIKTNSNTVSAVLT